MSVFVGRSLELSTIEDALDAARVGVPHVVWIEGLAGSGKSSVVREALRRVGSDAIIHQTDGDELAARESYAAVAKWLAEPRPESPFRAGMALLDGLDAVETGQFTVVVVEDMHWVDAASRGSLLTMARRFEHAPVVMIVTSRPDERADDGWDRLRSDPTRCRNLVLDSLSVGDIVELASGRGIALSRRDAERIHEHTAGHALYVSTLLADLPPERLRLSTGPLPVPRSLASTTLARLAELPGAARDLASAMAVVNRPAPLPMIGLVASIDEPSVALDALLVTGFVDWQQRGPLSVVTFAHPLYRTAIYDDLSPTRRRELHLAAALVSDEAAALGHRVAASDRADERLAADLEAAAERLADLDDRETAATYLRWAADVSENRGGHERRLLLSIGALLDAGDNAAASQWADWVERCAQTPRRNVTLGRLCWDRGDATAAEQWLRAATDQEDDQRVAIEALLALSVLLVTHYRGADAVDVSRRLLDLVEPDSVEEPEAWTTLAIGQGAVHGAPAGLSLLRERLRQRAGDVAQRDVSMLLSRGLLSAFAGRQADAAEDLRESIRRGGAPEQLVRQHMYLSRAEYAIGEWDSALVNGRVALELSAQEQYAWELAQSHRAVTSVLAARGEWESADRHASLAVEAAADSGGVEQYFSGRLALADLARARRDHAGVVAALEPLSVGGVDAMPMMSTLLWWAALIEARIAAGSVDSVAAEIAELERGFDARRLEVGDRLMGLRGRFAAATGDADAAADCFERALGADVGSLDWLDRAGIHREYGRVLRAVGRRQASIEQLRAARQMLVAVGATPYVVEIDAELAAAGLTAAYSGGRRSPLGLTDREQDVAALVTQGMTNKEVGAALYVSAKAVEYHLSNIYGKLGLSSRRELRDRMTADS